MAASTLVGIGLGALIMRTAQGAMIGAVGGTMVAVFILFAGILLDQWDQ